LPGGRALGQMFYYGFGKVPYGVAADSRARGSVQVAGVHRSTTQRQTGSAKIARDGRRVGVRGRRAKLHHCGVSRATATATATERHRGREGEVGRNRRTWSSG
jgi:hypothetical protein